MAHILSEETIKAGLISLLFCLACHKQAPKQYEGEILNKTKSDTIPLIKKESLRRTKNIKEIFKTIPNHFFSSSLFPELSQVEKEQLLVSPKSMKDVVVDTSHYYIFFDKETKEQDKGILTTVKAFPYTDGTELVIVEISKWSEDDTETEDIRCLKIAKDGSQIELSKFNIFPKIQLQDFFKQDISNQLPAPDHNSMPALLYEIQRNKNAIHVFLGEWKHPNETFSYKPDIDFVELRWEDDHFVKIGKIQ